MFNTIKQKLMAFADIFKDDNTYNEKTIVGFLCFTIMVIFAVVDIITGYLGKELIVNEFIYNSFLYITLGSFGIAEVSKVFNKNNVNTEDYIEDKEEEDI